ncbi:MAG: transposase, partial [Anaerolineae bacterium]
MGFDPDLHHRRSIRLRHWDYASAGAYFVTICVADRACVFGAVEDGQMRPNELGNLVTEYWRNLPRQFPTIRLDAFVVMPNHVHFVVWLNPPEDFAGARRVGAQFVGAQFVGAQFVGAQFVGA